MVAVRTKRTRAARTFKELMQVSGKSVTSILASRSADLSVVVEKVVEEADEVVVMVGKKVPEGVEVVVMKVVGLVKAMVEKKEGSETGSVRFSFRWWFTFFSLGVFKVSNPGRWSKL